MSELKPCPFCGCSMRLESNRDWHRIVGDHALECAFTDSETMVVPATKSSVILLSPTGTPSRTRRSCSGKRGSAAEHRAGVQAGKRLELRKRSSRDERSYDTREEDDRNREPTPRPAERAGWTKLSSFP